MNRKTIILVTLGFFIAFFMYRSLQETKPIEVENSPDWVSLEEAQVQSASTGKLIMVDVFEIGCKYCRAMEREVYPDSTVRLVIDQGYIPVKLDGNSEEPITINGEQMSSREFAQSKGAFVFPTVLVLDSQGELIKKRTGYMGIDELRQFLYRKES